MRADAQKMHVGEFGLELFTLQRLGQCFDLAVTGRTQRLDGGGMDALQHQKLDLAFVQGGLAHAGA